MTTARIRRSYNYACTKAKSTTVKMRLFIDTSVAVASDLFRVLHNHLSLRYLVRMSVCRTCINLDEERKKGAIPCTCVNLRILYIDNNVYTESSSIKYIWLLTFV